MTAEDHGKNLTNSSVEPIRSVMSGFENPLKFFTQKGSFPSFKKNPSFFFK